MIPPGKQLTADVFATVDATPRSRMEIWSRLDCWAMPSIAHALGHLVKTGQVVREQQPLRSGGFRYLYHVSPGTPGHPLTDPPQHG